MRHVRRFIAIITGIAAWCIAVTTTAYAKLPDPIYDHVPSGSAGVLPHRGSGVAQTPTPTGTLAGTPLWQVLAYWALGILLVVAVVGLGYALSHARRTRTSTGLRA